MSRIGKKVIIVPEKTEVKIADGFFSVKGPLGESKRKFGSLIKITIDGKEIRLLPTKENLESKAMWGTYASHIMNMIEGVNKAFEKKLILEGVGFKAEVKGNELVMGLGFSHPVKMAIPSGIKVVVEKGVLTFSSIDKELIGSFVAKIRALKEPEPYKGKGFRYSDEVIRRKQGKKTT